MIGIVIVLGCLLVVILSLTGGFFWFWKGTFHALVVECNTPTTGNPKVRAKRVCTIANKTIDEFEIISLIEKKRICLYKNVALKVVTDPAGSKILNFSEIDNLYNNADDKVLYNTGYKTSGDDGYVEIEKGIEDTVAQLDGKYYLDIKF